MATTLDKDLAKAIVDKLPDSATWEDLMHEIYVRQTIEAGLADSLTGRTRDCGKVREHFGLGR